MFRTAIVVGHPGRNHAESSPAGRNWRPVCEMGPPSLVPPELRSVKEVISVAALRSVRMLMTKKQFEEVGWCQFGRSLLRFCGARDNFLVTDIFLLVLLRLLFMIP